MLLFTTWAINLQQIFLNDTLFNIHIPHIYIYILSNIYLPLWVFVPSFNHKNDIFYFKTTLFYNAATHTKLTLFDSSAYSHSKNNSLKNNKNNVKESQQCGILGTNKENNDVLV